MRSLRTRAPAPTWQMGRKITMSSATLFDSATIIQGKVAFLASDRAGGGSSVTRKRGEFDGRIRGRIDTRPAQPLGHVFPSTTPSPGRTACRTRSRPLDFAELGRLDLEVPRRNDFPALDLFSLWRPARTKKEAHCQQS